MTFKDTKAIFVRNFQTKAKGDICDTRGKFSRVSACKGLCMVQQLCHDFLCSIGERLRVPTLLNSLLGLDCDHRLTTNLLICQNNLSQSIYTSPFVYFRCNLVLERGISLFFNVHIEYAPSRFLVVFGPNATVLKFEDFFFVYLIELIVFWINSIKWLIYIDKCLNCSISWVVSPCF